MNSDSKPTSRSHAILATVVLTSVAIMPVSAPQCNIFFMCPLNHFCYKPSGICIQCLNCSSYNRLSSVSRNCHESAQDCGECFSGFKEEYLARKIRREACVLSKLASAVTTTTTTTTNTATMETNTTSAPGRTVMAASVIPKEMITTIAAISVLSVVIFSLIGARFFRSKRRKSTPEQDVAQDMQSPTSCTEPSSFPLLLMYRGNMNNSSSTLQEHPPPYNEDDPGETVVTVSEERTLELHLPMQTNYQTPLSAMPFTDPLYARSSSSESNEGYDELPTEPHFPAIDDEDTNPSAWEPIIDQRPRNIQETDDTTVSANVLEADLAHPPVPSSDVEQTLQPSHSIRGNLPLTEPLPVPATDNNLEVLSDVGASSSSLELDRNFPFRHLGSESDQEEPIRKRARQDDDTQSLGDAPEASVPPFLDQNSYSSLFEDVLVSSQPNRVPSATSEQNLRRV